MEKSLIVFFLRFVPIVLLQRILTKHTTIAHVGGKIVRAITDASMQCRL